MESCSKVDTAKAKARILAKLLPTLETQVKELEAELERTWDSVTDLELRMEDREASLRTG